MNDETRSEMRSANIAKLTEALSKAQGVMAGAVKDSQNPFFNSTYADLASVWDACRKPLVDNGLAVVQIPGNAGSEVSVDTVLTHVSGEWISCRLTAKPKDQGPQAIGTVITYLRRYGLASIVGIAQVDDDGESAEGLNADQLQELVNLLEEEGVSGEEQSKWLDKLARKFGARYPARIPAAEFEKAKDTIVTALIEREKS